MFFQSESSIFTDTDCKQHAAARMFEHTTRLACFPSISTDNFCTILRRAMLGLSFLLCLVLSLTSFLQITVSKSSKNIKRLADREYKMVIKTACVVLLVFLTSFVKLLTGRVCSKSLLRAKKPRDCRVLRYQRAAPIAARPGDPQNAQETSGYGSYLWFYLTTT
jgi:hypothetical protein